MFVRVGSKLDGSVLLGASLCHIPIRVTSFTLFSFSSHPILRHTLSLPFCLWRGLKLDSRCVSGGALQRFSGLRFFFSSPFGILSFLLGEVFLKLEVRPATVLSDLKDEGKGNISVST